MNAPVPSSVTDTTVSVVKYVPLKSGKSASIIALKAGFPAKSSGAAKNVLAVCESKSLPLTLNVPPKVKLPVSVTVPVKVNPLTLPVPDTDVTASVR